MRTRRLISLVALLLMVVLLLSACTSHRAMSKGESYRELAATPTSANAVEALLGAFCEDEREELVYVTSTVTEGENTYKKHMVYNLRTNAIVLTVTDTLTTSVEVILLGTDDGYPFFVVQTTLWQLIEDQPDHYTYRTVLCSADGTAVADVDSLALPQTELDLIVFGGKCYRMSEDGTIAYAFDLGDLAVLPELTGRVKDHYFYGDDDGKVMLYDDECRLLAYYQAPSDVLMAMPSLLENGNVLLQYLIAEPEEAEKYSFVVTGGSSGMPDGKYTLVSKLIKKSGSIKDIKLDWFFLQIVHKYDTDFVQETGYASGYDNLAIGFEIADGRMDASMFTMKIVKLSNKGKVEGEIKTVVEGQIATDIEFVGVDRWIVSDVSEREFLINEKGKVVGEVTGAAWQNADYFLAADKLYDYDLNVVYDYGAAEQALYDGSDGVLRHGVLLEGKDGAVACYANGAAVSIIAKDAAREIVYIAENYFVVADRTDSLNVKYDVYNDVGAKLVTLDYMPSEVAELDGGVRLLCYLQADGKYVYYRLDCCVD